MNHQDKSESFTILVGYDGTRTAQKALDLALFHARHFHARVYVVFSLVGADETSVSEIEAADSALQHAEDALRAAQVPCAKHLLIRGLSAGEDLVRFATDHQMDEIIVGVKRRSQVGKLIFGSTARFVIVNAPCPVVTVR